MTDTQTYSGPIWRRGAKTLLCPIQEDNLPFFQHMVNDVEVQKFIAIDWPLSTIGQQRWFEKVSEPDPNRVAVAIRTLEGELIGNMEMRFNEKKRSAETGSLIGRGDFRGKGYGTDAKMTLLNYAFNERDMRKVTSRIIGYNIRSRKYARKCGYRFTARIPGEYFRFGKWRSEVIYTCWKEEWLPRWKQYKKSTFFDETE